MSWVLEKNVISSMRLPGRRESEFTTLRINMHYIYGTQAIIFPKKWCQGDNYNSHWSDSDYSNSALLTCIVSMHICLSPPPSSSHETDFHNCVEIMPPFVTHWFFKTGQAERILVVDKVMSILFLKQPLIPTPLLCSWTATVEKVTHCRFLLLILQR